MPLSTRNRAACSIIDGFTPYSCSDALARCEPAQPERLRIALDQRACSDHLGHVKAVGPIFLAQHTERPVRHTCHRGEHDRSVHHDIAEPDRCQRTGQNRFKPCTGICAILGIWACLALPGCVQYRLLLAHIPSFMCPNCTEYRMNYSHARLVRKIACVPQSQAYGAQAIDAWQISTNRRPRRYARSRAIRRHPSTPV